MQGIAIGAVLLLLAIAFPSCTVISSYNALQRRDETVKAAYTGLLSVYKKRSDMVPNLVDTVKGYAGHESDVFKSVTEARSKVGQTQLPAAPENATPEQMAEFARGQQALGGALSRLLVVSERYPELKANANFMQLQSDLRNIETQANAARNRYIREVQAFNTNVRTFPSNVAAMVFGISTKPQLEFEDAKEIQKSPRVDFKKS